jgi:hypothetical protein
LALRVGLIFAWAEAMALKLKRKISEWGLVQKLYNTLSISISAEQLLKRCTFTVEGLKVDRHDR